MIDDKVVKCRIAEIVTQEKNCEFAVIPYGNNGLMVENILRAYFDIKLTFVVDNKYCNYNKKIIDLEHFKKSYTERIYVCLTAEDQALNKLMLKQLREFIPEEKILNLCEMINPKESDGRVYDQFELNSFLPDGWNTNKEEIKKKDKIKVRILHSSAAMWNSISSICREFHEDERFEFEIIIHSMFDDDKKKMQVEREGFDYIWEQEYDVAEDRPDIFIQGNEFYCPKDRVKYRKNIKMVVMVTMSLIHYGSQTIEEFLNKTREGMEGLRPDYYLFDSLLFDKVCESDLLKGTVVEMGNAKFDGIYKVMQQKVVPDEWRKLDGKKVVLWATTHGVYGEQISSMFSFDKYAKIFFECAAEHGEVGFIFRPHSTFVNEMLKYGYWDVKELSLLKKYVKNTPNIVWDENDTYEKAYSISDVIITDGFCGVICSALPTLKPIAVLYRNSNIEAIHPEIVNNYYKIFDQQGFMNFFRTVVIEGKDTLFEKRKKISDEFVKSFDGNNGKRIKKFIEKEYIAKYGNLPERLG